MIHSVKSVIAAVALVFAITGVSPAQEVLVPRGAVWRYLDNGSDQGTAWRELAFPDRSWRSGRSQLGYGDGDEATVVSYGSSPFSKHITTYFRHAFAVAEPHDVVGLRLRLLRDDGAVVYLNGTEVVRSNLLPFVSIDSDTPAFDNVTGDDEDELHDFRLLPEPLRAGRNVLAVEIHQDNPFSSDISFDLELVAESRTDLVRGPYLQRGTPTAMTVRWRTAEPTVSRVRYGLAPDRLDASAEAPGAVTEHAVLLAGLTPETRYYYSVGYGTNVLAGGDAQHSFVTPPLPGTRKPTRVWVLGDSGTADSSAAAVRDAYLAFTGERRTDLWLMLGDNAYDSGTDAEFQAAVFDMYAGMLRQSVLWPTRGNHEKSASTYYGIFTLPRSGEAGGMPSGTEAYYSFDHANVHFVCLDSFESNPLPGGSMHRWLESDLASTDQDWIVAFWHHPPYSEGSNPSDDGTDSTKMRLFFLPLLEEGGVDLVLTGHSHCYERSYLIDGHYGFSFQFDASNLRDGGDGREDGDGAYHKAPIPHAGAVYCVAGCSGRVSSGDFDHPVMFYSVSTLGSLVLDVDGDRMDVRFLTSTGEIEDRFTLRKYPDQGLSADTTTASITRGGSQHFQIDAGASLAGREYWLLGSMTGTAPGVPLGPVTLPLVPDSYTSFVVAQTNTATFVENRGRLDAAGRAAPSIHLPPGLPAALIGHTFFHAYAVFGAPGPTALFASNPFPLTLVP